MKKAISQPKLTVVGAGPGDEELITLKAIAALADADVILYDALVNEVLLKYADQNNLRGLSSYRKQSHNNRLGFPTVYIQEVCIFHLPRHQVAFSAFLSNH